MNSQTTDQIKGKIYFVSDFHFGVPDHNSSLEREKQLIRWFEEVKKDAAEIYLMGDLFDFWFEYKTVIPKGFTRFLGKLAEMTDAGIPVHLFRGNHDIWAFDYLNRELNIILHRKPEIRVWNGKRFYLAHGDGLGPGDRGYKFLKKTFECPLNQWFYRWLHPDIGTRMGLFFSRRSRNADIAREKKNADVVNIPTQRLYQFSLQVLESDPGIDYFIFGHHHLPVHLKINEKTHFFLIGDWITNFSYVVFDGKEVELKFFR
ncbi:MAG: UDP-2,3-diacylglucosamine diphosphatase [Bacteroidales bacterium]|nr:UDP-2,3-diacylglucosamine diphosphatase [Lentimicrobiaceae bacterium]MDD5694538.1 UDP-2,3-diacylglucosamine diphosphatase [Bacteroidales bacterium]